MKHERHRRPKVENLQYHNQSCPVVRTREGTFTFQYLAEKKLDTRMFFKRALYVVKTTSLCCKNDIISR